MSQPQQRRTPAEVARALRAWLTRLPADWPPADDATRSFCHRRLESLADENALEAKIAADLGTRTWRPLGHVLAIVSENDHMGVIATLVAAALTGNRLTIKSRSGLAVLAILRESLGWNEAACRLADWNSQSQGDADLLVDVDGIVMAGGESLIRHYRQSAAPRIRLVEYGPQMSAAWIADWPNSATEQATCVDALLRDTTLFLQNVCSAPQFVRVPDEATAKALFAALAARLPELPALPDDIRMQQSAKAQELRLLARLGQPVDVALHTANGWAVTRSPADPAFWLPRGFRLIVGTADQLRNAFPPLQTLGVWPAPDHGHTEMALHCCRLGRMHERPITAPHDGHWELAQWVRFVSCDGESTP